MVDESQDRLRGYVVISKTLVDAKRYEGCKVIPSGEPYPATFRQVYGPASQQECNKWAATHCTAPGAEES
jgi:hypothetical protein